MLTRLGVLSVVCLSVLTANATTIITRTPVTESSESFLQAVSWTQTSTFTGVSINADLESSAGGTAMGTAYLTDSLGPGTTKAANEIASTPISVTSSSFTSVNLFSGLTLAPNTYYLVIQMDEDSLHHDVLDWGFSSAAITVVGPGVTSNPDQSDNTTGASYPPANSFAVKAQGLIYSVTSNTSVPEPGALGLVFASLCCAGLLLRRRGR